MTTMNQLKTISSLVLALALFSFAPKEKAIVIKVKNNLNKVRSFETIALTKSFLKVDDLNSLGIRDKKT